MELTIGTLLFHLQRTIRSYVIRETLSKAQSRLIGKPEIVGKSRIISENEEQCAEKLSKDGFVEFQNGIGAVKVQKIVEETANLSMSDPYEKRYGEFKLDNINPSTHVAFFNRKDLVGNATILEIANDPGILRVVQKFLGATPTISNICMWWSMAGKSKAEHAQLFHRDVDDLKFCKLFVYLTDVGPKDGPHTYVKGSSSVNRLTKIRRYEDQEIESAFGIENIVDFCRPKGSIFLVDTYGFHKGTLPIDNNRLLLQIQYSLNPIGIEAYTPVKVSHNYDQYVNRLLTIS